MPQVVGAESMNPRCYELAATGCFYLSDPREELAEVMGLAVPTFRTADELGGLIRRYLDAPDERRRLTALARERIAPHTFDARIATILDVMESHR
jgi:spore maturation protein CgeB